MAQLLYPKTGKVQTGWPKPNDIVKVNMSEERKTLEEAMDKAAKELAEEAMKEVGDDVGKQTIDKVNIGIFSDGMKKVHDRAAAAIVSIDEKIQKATEDCEAYVQRMNVLKEEQEKVLRMARAALDIDHAGIAAVAEARRPVRKRATRKKEGADTDIA